MEIPDDAKLFIVDGQHRIEGLKRAVNDFEKRDLQDFHLPVVFLCTGNWTPPVGAEIEEGKQFITINKMQTGVKGELFDSFLLALDMAAKASDGKAISGLPEEIVTELRPRVRALLVVLILNAIQSSMWEGKVTRPNQRKGNTLVGQKAAVDSLKDFVNLQQYVESFPDETLGTLALNLMHYWEAIMDYYPNALAQPKDFWIQKRLGVTVFHRIFPKIDVLVQGEKSKANYAKVLKKAKMPSEHFWSKVGGAKGITSFSSVSALASEIWP